MQDPLSPPVPLPLRLPGRVPARSVVDQISDQIIELVVTGKLEPGQSLPIHSLGSALGVSHVPIREALRRLESEGLIQYKRGRGARVAPVGIRDLTEIINLQIVVEEDVARRSVRMLDNAALKHAADRLEVFIQALDDSSQHPAAISPAHTAFHYALMPGATTWDRRILNQLFRASERYIQLYSGYDHLGPAARDETIEQHRRLLADAQNGGDLYVDKVRGHVEWSRNTLVRLIEAQTTQF